MLNLKIANGKKVLFSLPLILHQSCELHQGWISAHFGRSSAVSTVLTARPTVQEYWQSHYPTRKNRVDKSYTSISHSAQWANTVKPGRDLNGQFQWTNDSILSHKASTRCFCPQNWEVRERSLRKQKKLDLLVESIKRLEKEAVYCQRA